MLRHQLAVLRRQAGQPRMSWADRALIAALVRRLPSTRRIGLLVTPATILRWHRRLVTHRWTTSQGQPGRPPVPAGLRTLATRLANENPTWATGECTANSPASATRSAPPPSGRSSRPPESTPHHSDPGRPGHSSSEPKPTPSCPATCSTSTPSPCTGPTRSSSSSTPAAGYTSWVSPPTRPAPG